MSSSGMFDTKALGMFAPESKFHFDDVPDLTGRTVIVTGANVSSISIQSLPPSSRTTSYPTKRYHFISFPPNVSREWGPSYSDYSPQQTGLGKITAQVLLDHNAKVYAACRSVEKAEAAIEEIKKNTGKTDIQ